ncbi:hypothetical protein TNCV_2858531 [Trichonephila clavipes]|nr:hypothetical protein TNCV_2858531 [Trichonephila clavipes]
MATGSYLTPNYSRSQKLSKMDSTSLDIISKLARLGRRKQVCLQWIPSHVDVPENEAADELAGIGVVISLTLVSLP